MSDQVICIGAALVDSIIRGFDPEPVSASGYRADSSSLKGRWFVMKKLLDVKRTPYDVNVAAAGNCGGAGRSEEHTSELQSRI